MLRGAYAKSEVRLRLHVEVVEVGHQQLGGVPVLELLALGDARADLARVVS